MAISNRLFVQSTIALLFVGFLALLSIVGMTFWLSERAQFHYRHAAQVREMRIAAVEARNAVQAAEASQRGFLFTGNEIYLAPYDTAKTVAQRQLALLSRILESDEQTRAAMQRLPVIVADKIKEMDETIELKRGRRDEELTELIRSNRGKALMDEANIFFSGVIRVAEDRLAASVAEQRANAALLRLFSIIGGVIIVAVIGGATLAVIRYTRELAEARDEVRELNAGLEERVKDRTSALVRANAEIQRFAYIVSHDLRAPLISIMGFSKVIEESATLLREQAETSGGNAERLVQTIREATTDDLPEAVGFIRSATVKMESLINAILKLSREGQRTLQPQAIQLKDIVAASASAMQHQVSEAGGEIRIDAEVPAMFTDKLSLEQIFGNLLDNAVKYRSKDRPLRIDVRASRAPGDRVRIEVTDNGRGIAEKDRQRVFELFRRAGPEDQPGEGIGLAYVLAVVRNLGGEIGMTSELGKGTTFHVVLPRHLEASQLAA
jgi:signal transduction histidine kinase